MTGNPERKVETSAVILAAGKGVRMVSPRAKTLHSLCGEPLLDHILRAVKGGGVTRTLVVVGYQGKEVEAAFSGSGIEFVTQAEQRGTGHALMQTEEKFAGYRGDLLVLPGDVPLLTSRTIAELLDTHRQSGAAVTLLTSSIPDPSGYGRVIRSSDGTVERIVEEADATPVQKAVHEINVGVYCFGSRFLFLALAEISNDNSQGELYLTDVIEMAVRQRERVEAIDAPWEEAQGVNTREELARAEAIMQKKINQQWMLQGVTMVDPDTTFVQYNARIGEDTTIHPGCHIQGSTSIGKGCTIMPGAVIMDSIIGNHARLGPYCILEGCELPDGASVGPFEIKEGNHQP